MWIVTTLLRILAMLTLVLILFIFMCGKIFCFAHFIAVACKWLQHVAFCTETSFQSICTFCVSAPYLMFASLETSILLPQVLWI